MLRLLRQRQPNVCGCWVRRPQDEWRWVGTGSAPSESPSGQRVWSAVELLVVAEPPLKPSVLRRVRRAWRRHAQRCLARRFVMALNAQREILGNVLHRGPCQSMTAAQLQSGLVNLSDGEERVESQRDLEKLLEQANADLRLFYETRLLRYPQGISSLSRRWPQLDWQALAHPELWFELLLCAWERNPDVCAAPGGLRLTFPEGPPQSEVWAILLRLFPLFGYTVKQLSRQTLVLQPESA